MNHTTSEELFAEAKTLIPGGVNSPVRAFKSVGCNPVFIEKASGSKILVTIHLSSEGGQNENFHFHGKFVLMRAHAWHRRIFVIRR